MLILALHKDRLFLQNAKKFVLLSANKRTKRKLLLFPQGETSRNWPPWQLKNPGTPWLQEVGAVGWNSEYQEEPLCFWLSHLQLWSCLSVPLLHVSGQAGLIYFFVKSSSEQGEDHSQMGSVSQLWIKCCRSTELMQLVPWTEPFWLFHYSVLPWSPQDLRGPCSSNLSTTTVKKLKVLHSQNIPHVTLQAAQGIKSGQK